MEGEGPPAWCTQLLVDVTRTAAASLNCSWGRKRRKKLERALTAEGREEGLEVNHNQHKLHSK